MEKSNTRYYKDITYEKFMKMVKKIVKDRDEKLNNARQQLADSQS